MPNVGMIDQVLLFEAPAAFPAALAPDNHLLFSPRGAAGQCMLS